MQATAIAHPNIAFIKYWGNLDSTLNLPANGSISMNLANLEARTTVQFQPDLTRDRFILNQQTADPAGSQRVFRVLDEIRRLANLQWYAKVDSQVNFPPATGIASSAAGFAALALAGSQAAGLSLTEPQLSRLARLGSGSASRSIPSGFVEWVASHQDDSSYAFSIAQPDHWLLYDLIAVLQTAPKKTSSKNGHTIADTSLLQAARVADAPRRLDICRQAILQRDFNLLADIIETDSNLMHAIMISSRPALFYWSGESLEIMKAVPLWRQEGLQVAYTLDAGPNVHLICDPHDLPAVRQKVQNLLPQVAFLESAPGGPAHLTSPLE